MCDRCDARLQCKLDYWNGAKRDANPFIEVEGVSSPAWEAWDEEWQALQGKADLYDDFHELRTQQEAAKSIAKYPPLTKGRLIKQLLAVLSK